VASLIGAAADRRAAGRVDPALLPAAADPAAQAQEAAETVPLHRVPGRFLRCLARLAVVLVPEYLIVVFAVGLLGPWLTPALSARSAGVLTVVVAALVGAMLVLPTGGEIPILLGLAAAGASAGVLGALLVVLPTVSLPSAVMVGRALGWGTTAVAFASVVLTGVLAGGLLVLVS